MVKYMDSPSANVEVEINAPTDAVWPVVSDINVPGAFSQEFQRAEWIDHGPALGATFRGYNRHEQVGQWNVLCTVTDFEPGRTFEWTVGDVDNKVARWRFDLISSDGGSTLRFSAEMGPGPSGLTPAIKKMPDREEEIVARRLSEWAENMKRTAEGIKGLAESGAAEAGS